MIWAFSRLILIFSFVVFTFVFVIFMIRSNSERSTYPDYQHPIWEDQPLLIALGGDLDFGPSQSLKAYHASLQFFNETQSPKFKSLVLGAKVRLTKDGEWVLFSNPKLDQLTNGKGFVSQHTRDEISKLNYLESAEKILFLEDFLNEFKENVLYLDIQQPAHIKLNSLFEMIEKQHPSHKVIITSDFTDTIREVRKQNVRWLSGFSHAEISKTFLLTSIFLEPALSFDGDVFVSEKYHERLMAEIIRKKRIMVLHESEYLKASKISANLQNIGVLTPHMSRFIRSLSH